MIRTLAVVLLGLFRSWEFLFIAGLVVIGMPFVFSLAAARPHKRPYASRRGKRKSAAKPTTKRKERDETSEVE